jgi:hypothetical protein
MRMKTKTCFFALGCSVSLLTRAATAPDQSPGPDPAGASVQTNLAPTARAIASRGPHSRIWKRAQPAVTPSGQVFYTTNSYTEIGTGLGRLVGNEYVDTKAKGSHLII